MQNLLLNKCFVCYIVRWTCRLASPLFFVKTMDKNEIRRLVRSLKKNLPLEEKIRRSMPILQQVEQLKAFADARCVLAYWSMDDEVHTHDFLNRWYERKCMLLPCVEGDDLLLRQYTGPSSLRPGPQFGIPEPVGPLFEQLDKIEMIVVPGVAFDRKGDRMGRGRGFYDRLLKTTPKAMKVGVAFDFQMFDEIPMEPFDVPMDVVVSE